MQHLNDVPGSGGEMAEGTTRQTFDESVRIMQETPQEEQLRMTVEEEQYARIVAATSVPYESLPEEDQAKIIQVPEAGQAPVTYGFLGGGRPSRQDPVSPDGPSQEVAPDRYTSLSEIQYARENRESIGAELISKLLPQQEAWTEKGLLYGQISEIVDRMGTDFFGQSVSQLTTELPFVEENIIGAPVVANIYRALGFISEEQLRDVEMMRKIQKQLTLSNKDLIKGGSISNAEWAMAGAPEPATGDSELAIRTNIFRLMQYSYLVDQKVAFFNEIRKSGEMDLIDTKIAWRERARELGKELSGQRVEFNKNLTAVAPPVPPPPSRAKTQGRVQPGKNR